MATRLRSGGWATRSVSAPAELFEAIEALAARNGRSVSAEITHAIERHLAAPPTLKTPALRAADVEDATPRAKRGRPKNKGGEQ